MCDKSMTAIKRYELVEVVILNTAAAGAEVNFPNTPNLQNDTEQKIIIRDIEVFPNYVQTNSIKNQGTVVMPPTELPKISLVLYYENGEWIRYVPLAKMNYTQPPAGTASAFQQERVAFDNISSCAIEKCYLKFNAAPAFAVGTQYVVPLGITYEKFVKV